jgi:hypothetical protein
MQLVVVTTFISFVDVLYVRIRILVPSALGSGFFYPLFLVTKDCKYAPVLEYICLRPMRPMYATPYSYPSRVSQINREHNSNTLFAWLISHLAAVLFSQNKSTTSNQPTVLFSQNKSAPAISHQPNEGGDEGRGQR